MPYKPRVENDAGAIYARGIKTAAGFEAAGIEKGAAGLAEGLEKFGVKFGEGLEKAGAVWQQQAAQKKADADLWSALNTKISTMGQYGHLTGRDADALAGIKKPNDLAAALTVIEADIGRRQQQQQSEARDRAVFERQYALEAMRQNQQEVERRRETEERAKGAQPGDTKVIVDPVTGQRTSFVFQNSAQLIPLNEQKSDKPKLTGVKKVEIGNGQFIYTDQDGNQINPKMIGGTAEDSPMATKLEELKIKRAELAGEVAKGDKKKGADWMPGLTAETQPYETQIKGIDAQISELEGGAPAQPATAAPAKQYANDAEVIAAIKAGTLSREEGIKILMGLHQ